VVEFHRNLHGKVEFDRLQVADIARKIHVADSLNQVVTHGTFRIYKYKLPDEFARSLNVELLRSAETEGKGGGGISVSNAGGFHGKPNYFNGCNEDVVKQLADVVSNAVQAVELDDYVSSIEKSKDDTDQQVAKLGSNETCKNAIRQLQSAGEAEAWININQHGHWNRLHTHEGAVWSGVYYIHSKKESLLREYSGQLLLKPTPHITENSYRLSDVELGRLNCSNGTTNQAQPQGEGQDLTLMSTSSDTAITHLEGITDSHPHPQPHHSNRGSCDYIQVPAEEGTMIIFPSWLHHAVVPLSIKEEYRGTEEGLRISLAFNFNEAVKAP
jgi:hypothetical protein